MFLQELVNKEIFSGKNAKGICRGVGISLKSHAVKYLLCASTPTATHGGDFSVSTSAVERIEEGVFLTKLRPLFPKNCARVFLGCPIYSFDGVFLGNLTDLEMKGFAATQIFTDQATAYPVTAITACKDALILKREQPFPLGQRVPTPLLPLVTDKKDAVVTKPLLRTAIQNGALVKLTLSLPPFSLKV